MSVPKTTQRANTMQIPQGGGGACLCLLQPLPSRWHYSVSSQQKRSLAPTWKPRVLGEGRLFSDSHPGPLWVKGGPDGRGGQALNHDQLLLELY